MMRHALEAEPRGDGDAGRAAAAPFRALERRRGFGRLQICGRLGTGGHGSFAIMFDDGGLGMAGRARHGAVMAAV